VAGPRPAAIWEPGTDNSSSAADFADYADFQLTTDYRLPTTDSPPRRHGDHGENRKHVIASPARQSEPTTDYRLPTTDSPPRRTRRDAGLVEPQMNADEHRYQAGDGRPQAPRRKARRNPQSCHCERSAAASTDLTDYRLRTTAYHLFCFPLAPAEKRG
jgi:hypothetical protein